MRTTRCGVQTRCEKQSLTRPVISPSGSAVISSPHSLRATATATSTASVSIRASMPEKRGAAVAFRLGLALGGLVAGAIGAGLGGGDPLDDFGRGGRTLARLVRRRE